jgi:hypothetical protein
MDESLSEQLQDEGLSPRQAEELEHLAHDIEGIPRPKPSKRWLAESKARLLNRFDEDSRADAPPPEPEE